MTNRRIGAIRHYTMREYSRSVSASVDDLVTGADTSDDFNRDYYAFVCLRHNPRDNRLYCGMTNLSQDLLYAFSPRDKRFECLGYNEFGEKFEVKIHRALEIDTRGMIVGATSCLHGPDKRMEAPGGKIFQYNPAAKKYETICIPKEHDYIQTISFDNKRGMIYGFTYPVFDFFVYSMEQREVVYRQFMDSIVHISAIDDAGGYWGTWSRKHNLFRYDPEKNTVQFHDHGFPEKGGNLMYPGAGPIDCMVNGYDGFMYVATDLGSLYRLNPANAQLEFLGKPFAAQRMPGLILGDDGLLYMSGGDDYASMLACYDRNTGNFQVMGKIQVENGESCFRTHDIEKIGNAIYVGETDNPDRGDFLWECTIEN